MSDDVNLMSVEDEQDALQEMREYAQEAMNAPVDPRDALYFVNPLTGNIVVSEQEHEFLDTAGVQMPVVNYGKAVSIMGSKRHRAVSIARRRAKNKVARRSRKQNGR